MDVKQEIKEEPSFSEFCPQNERELFTQDLEKKIKSETVTSDSDCDTNTNTEVEEKALVSNFCPQNERKFFIKDFEKKVKSEPVTDCYIKTETKEALDSNFCSLDQREFFSEHPTMKLDKRSNSEIETQIEVKEEKLWMGGAFPETMNIYNDIKDGRNENPFSIKSPREAFIEEQGPVDDVSHSSLYHSELCNGDIYIVLCLDPTEHGQMTSYFTCNKQCSVYMRKSQCALRSIPDYKDNIDSTQNGATEEYLPPAEEDTKPIDIVLKLDNHAADEKSSQAGKRSARKTVRTCRKKKAFAEHLRKLRLLEKRMRQIVNHPDGHMPEKDATNRAPRRVHLQKLCS